MKKIPIGAIVKVDGPANQWPFERICTYGVVIDNDSYGCRNARYLIQLNTKETLRFKRRDITVIV